MRAPALLLGRILPEQERSAISHRRSALKTAWLKAER